MEARQIPARLRAQFCAHVCPVGELIGLIAQKLEEKGACLPSGFSLEFAECPALQEDAGVGIGNQ